MNQIYPFFTWRVSSWYYTRPCLHISLEANDFMSLLSTVAVSQSLLKSPMPYHLLVLWAFEFQMVLWRSWWCCDTIFRLMCSCEFGWGRESGREKKYFFFARKVARAVKKIKRDLKHKLILRGKYAHRRAKIDSANSGNSFQFPE